MDGVLKTLHEKLRFSVVSSKNKKQYDIDVVSLGLDDCMEVVVLEDDTSKHKPDPEPFLLCMERLELNKEGVMYVEMLIQIFLLQEMQALILRLQNGVV